MSRSSPDRRRGLRISSETNYIVRASKGAHMPYNQSRSKGEKAETEKASSQSPKWESRKSKLHLQPNTNETAKKPRS